MKSSAYHHVCGKEDQIFRPRDELHSGQVRVMMWLGEGRTTRFPPAISVQGVCKVRHKLTSRNRCLARRKHLCLFLSSPLHSRVRAKQWEGGRTSYPDPHCQQSFRKICVFKKSVNVSGRREVNIKLLFKKKTNRLWWRLRILAAASLPRLKGHRVL